MDDMNDFEPENVWQPIETVPYDGTPVDLWGSREHRIAGHQERRFADARWVTGDNFADGVSRWIMDQDEGEVGMEEDWVMTHWMPLPEPPAPPSDLPTRTGLPADAWAKLYAEPR